MKRREVVRKMRRALDSGHRYIEMVVYGAVDNTGAEQWRSIPMGMDGDTEWNEETQKQVRILVNQWIDFAIGRMDEDGKGDFLHGKVEAVAVLSGDDGKEIVDKIATVTQKHWRALSAKAIRGGMDAVLKERQNAPS